MKQNMEDKKIALFDFYKMNEDGKVVFAYGKNAFTEVTMENIVAYQIDEDKLAEMTNASFAVLVWAKKRQYNLYNCGNGVVCVVGKKEVEFAAGVVALLEMGL